MSNLGIDAESLTISSNPLKLNYLDDANSSISGSYLQMPAHDGIPVDHRLSETLSNDRPVNWKRPRKQTYNFRDVVYMTAEAWDSVKDTTLAKVWNKLLPSDNTTNALEEPPNTELAMLIQKSSGFEDQENIQEWLECDVGGNQLLMTDDEILATLKEDRIPSEDHNEEEYFRDEE